jgi:ADP-ribose pyrophosphatase
MFDGSFRTFEKLKRTNASVVIPVTTDGKIVVTDQQQPGREPYSALPGGHHDLGEDPLYAAKRELLEETGYVASEWELYTAIQPTSKVDWAIYYFVARDCTRASDIDLDGGEKINLRLLDFPDFLQYVRRPDFAERELKLDILEALLEPAKMIILRQKILGTLHAS